MEAHTRSRNTRFRRTCLALATALLGSVGLASTIGLQSASADQPDPVTDNSSVSAPAQVYNPDSGAVESLSAANEDVLRNYWTQERLDNAIPLNVTSPQTPAPDDSSQLPQPDPGPQTTIQPAAPTQPQPARPDTSEAVSNFSHTNGKVFFHNATDGKDYNCSASAVASGSRSMVATAGHCVHGGPGGTWHQNWVFIPGYHKGTHPNGTFPARSSRTMQDWINYGENARGFNSDVAFVSTYPNENGAKVVDAVGGHGLIWGGDQYEFNADIFGYPLNLDGGEVMWACWGTTGTRYQFYWGFYKFSQISGCNFGGGSSGGPWLMNYDNGNGLGLIKSITSFGPTDSTEYSAGPFFRSAIGEMYQAADND